MEPTYTQWSMEESLGRLYAQAEIETELPLARAAKELLTASVTAQSLSVKADKGSVTVAGELEVRAVLADEEGKLFGTRFTAQMRQEIDAEAADETASGTASVQIMEESFSLSGERLKFNAVLEIGAAVEKKTDVRVVSDVTGGAGVEKRFASVLLHRTEPLQNGRIEYAGELRVANVSEVLTASGKAFLRNVRCRASDETAEMDGILFLSALCVTDTGELVQINEQFGFNEAIDCPAAESISGRFEVNDVRVTPAPDEEGLFTVTASIAYALFAPREKAFQVLTDFYATDGDYLPEVQNIRLMNGGAWVSARTDIRERVRVPEGMPDALRAVYASARAMVSSVEEDPAGHARVSGIVTVGILYRCDAGKWHAMSEDLPFSVTIDAPVESLCSAQCLFAQAQGSLRAFDVTVAVLVQAVTATELPVTLPVGVTSDEDAPPREKGIVVYFTGAGETFWDVGKRFRVPEHDIAALNPGAIEPTPDGAALVVVVR